MSSDDRQPKFGREDAERLMKQASETDGVYVRSAEADPPKIVRDPQAVREVLSNRPESDFKPGSCDHEWSGRDGRCGMCGVRQSDEGTGVDRALNPDVTRNAMSPDELWAMQEKPHVSDDAPDMGPIPGTEGIESDPPVSDLSVEGSPPGGNQVPESPLHTPLEDANLDLIDKLQAQLTEVEAERDALRRALHRLCGDVLAFGGAELLEPVVGHPCPIHEAQVALGCEGWCQPESHYRAAEPPTMTGMPDEAWKGEM